MIAEDTKAIVMGTSIPLLLTTCSGCDVTAASLVMEMELVFEARMVSGAVTCTSNIYVAVERVLQAASIRCICNT